MRRASFLPIELRSPHEAASILALAIACFFNMRQLFLSVLRTREKYR